MDAGSLARIFLLLVIVGIGVAVVLLRKRKTERVDAVASTQAPLVRMFCERTGYAYADLRQAPPAAQAQRWEEGYRRSTEGYPFKHHLVRPYQGLEVNWENATRMELRTMIWSQTWWAPAPWPIHAPFHLTERKNLNQKLAPGQTVTWRPAFQRMVPIGDPELDHRFALFTPVDENRIRAILSNGQLRTAILQCVYVDLQVTPQGARFSDPKDDNATAILGGSAGFIQYVAQPGRRLEVTLPVHERIANILLGGLSLAR